MKFYLPTLKHLVNYHFLTSQKKNPITFEQECTKHDSCQNDLTTDIGII